MIGEIKMYSIIFDIDGTLWDSTDAVAESWNRAIKAETGIDAGLDAAKLKGLFGKTMDEIGLAMLPTLDAAERRRVCFKCYDYEDEYLKDHPGKFYDGVKETLLKLIENHDIYVVSNCQVGYIELTLKHLGLLDKVKDHLCYGDNELPKGENIKLIVERNKIAHPIYVGDIQGDYEACRIADVPMIYASYGFGEVKQPEYTIDDIKELPALIAKLDAEL